MLVKASLYIPIYLQPFLRYSDISAASREVDERFIAFCHILLSPGPWVRPWNNRDKCHTVGKRIQCL